MGGLLHLFDFDEDSMARKFLARKRQIDGLEAPRNSLELQLEASQICCAVGDGQAEEDWSENNFYPSATSIKRLINEEISNQSIPRKNAPSIVARLMGVDMLPQVTKPIHQPVDTKNESMKTKSLKKEKKERSSQTRFWSNSNSSRQLELDSFYYGEEREAERWSNDQKFGKSRPREHPQEEELQKFKQEFEAWQAARLRECSKAVDLGSNSGPLIAQEDRNKQQVALDSNSGIPGGEKLVEYMGLTSKGRSRETSSLQHHRHKVEVFPAAQKESSSSINRAVSRNFDHSLINYGQKPDKSSAPTRIVVLKPGPHRICDQEESWTSCAGTLEERGSIEDFLEEVKERLKCELQGKSIKRGFVGRGSGIETPFSEKPSDPKQIAKHIAKQVRESVTRDLGTKLLRSESTRSYRSELQFTGMCSPEFINKDTRKFLSDRLRNVLKRETHLHVPAIVSGCSGSSLLDSERARLKQGGYTSKSANEWTYLEILTDDQEMQTRSFRHGDGNGMPYTELSPRNLIRSLSAPVSGTSFGKLLLEDRHILTGAQIRRKHEALENATVELKKRKKERFNIKEKVSNFRYNFTMRGKLFRKKMQAMVESHESDQELVKDIRSGPTVIMNCGERHIMENSTEVPPSPASVCSGAQEEFWRPLEYPSPVSTPDVTLEEENAISHVFKEISSNLNELRRQLNQLCSNEHEDMTVEQESTECMMVDLEDRAEAYIRDLLVASGLYDGSLNKWSSRCDAPTKPINNLVFEEVEESYKKQAKDHENTARDENEKKVNHKIIFDLLNETLPVVLGPPVTISRFRRKIINSSMLPSLRGMKLLDAVWDIIHGYLYPPNDKSYSSVDGLVARNLERSPWCSLIDDEVSALGKEMECLIISDLLNEVVKDMHL